jgi:hypothetical protein
LTHITRAVRNQLSAAGAAGSGSDESLQAELRQLLERIEGQMHSLLQEVDSVEDSLLE